MKTLAIDTANQSFSVAILEEVKLLAEYRSTIKKTHSARLMPAVEWLMKEIGMKPHEIERIVVSKGPGSYTGLRIGVTTAKTLAWTLNCELVAVSSLKAIAANTMPKSDSLIVPLINARRENVYSGAYRWVDGELTTVLEDRHVGLSSWLEELIACETPIIFIGEDVSLFADTIKNAYQNDDVTYEFSDNVLSAASMARVAINESKVEDVHQFVPTYLKRVEAEEKWLETHEEQIDNYVKKI